MKFLFKLFNSCMVTCAIVVVVLPFAVYSLDVKVLLDPAIVGEFKISSGKEFIVQDPVSGVTIKSLADHKIFEIDIREDGGYVRNKKVFSNTLLFKTADNATISYNNKKYKGSFLIKKIKNKYALINSVPLEEYVFSVLKTESWPGWPLEVNRVFAIMIRTYCLYQMMLAQQKKLPYDIRNTNYHQTYHGVHTCKVRQEAVNDTQGVFISYENRPILAMFDCCCGGIVPADIEGVIDFVKAPYLERTYPCVYCKNVKSFNWVAIYRLNDFMDLVQNESDSIVHSIKDVKIVDRDNAGLVKQVVIKTSQNTISMTGDKMYRLSSKIKSYAFSVTKKGKNIIFKGTGFGHHMGLCQWGAREMVRRGFTFKDILSFYYPDTTLVRFVDTSNKGNAKKGNTVCRGIKDILSVVHLRSLV